jgi:hypothetical protein
MGNSYSTWNSMNEAFGAKARGKQVIKDPQSGKRQKIAFKVQNDNKILIRLVKMLSIVDAAGNITARGASILTEFMNSQLAILNSIPGATKSINDEWFKNHFFIYTVLKDTQTREDEGPAKNGREKIQLTIVNRADFPNIPAGAKFVNTNVAASGAESSPIIQDVVQDNQQTVAVDDTDEGANILQDDLSTGDAEGTEETQTLVGKKFRYTMRTNQKLYLMEFTEDGAIDARAVEDNKPNGVVSWQDPKVMWITDEDEGSAGWVEGWSEAAMPLYSDQEITNRIDKDFFTKIFTDSEFRDRIIKEYEDEWGDSELTAENIRKMLYYTSGEKIFPGASSPEPEPADLGDGAVSDLGPTAVDIYQQRTF